MNAKIKSLKGNVGNLTRHMFRYHQVIPQKNPGSFYGRKGENKRMMGKTLNIEL